MKVCTPIPLSSFLSNLTWSLFFLVVTLSVTHNMGRNAPAGASPSTQWGPTCSMYASLDIHYSHVLTISTDLPPPLHSLTTAFKTGTFACCSWTWRCGRIKVSRFINRAECEAHPTLVCTISFLLYMILTAVLGLRQQGGAMFGRDVSRSKLYTWHLVPTIVRTEASEHALCYRRLAVVIEMHWERWSGDSDARDECEIMNVTILLPCFLLPVRLTTSLWDVFADITLPLNWTRLGTMIFTLFSVRLAVIGA